MQSSEAMDFMSIRDVREERAVVVLAGGRSSRFGSEKALQVLAGKPLLRHVVDGVSDVAEELVVVVGRSEDPAKYRRLLPERVKIVKDELEGKNPLLGIVSGLAATLSEYAALISCDIPFVNRQVIELLFERGLNVDAAIPRWNDQRIEPLQAVYHRIITLKAASEALSPGDLSLKDMIKKLRRPMYVSVETEIVVVDRCLNTFFNVNTREDMKTAEKMLADKQASMSTADADNAGQVEDR